MAADDKDFETIAQGMADKQRQTDFDDLQNEIAGRETGRIRRFLPGDHRAEQLARNSRDQALTALQLMLMNDPEYAALYHEVDDLLALAETATQRALDQSERDLLQAEDNLSDTLENANKLPDGTAVFKDAKGNVWTEDGRLLEPGEAESIVWKDGAPTCEDYRKQKQSTEEIREQIEALRRYQIDVIGDARDRMNDQDNPVSKEELKDIQKDIYERADVVVQKELQPDMTKSSADADTIKPVQKPQI